MTAPRGAARARPLVDISRLRFLVVEDHSFQRWILEKALRELGVQVIHAAADGEGAMAVLRDETSFVDIVLTDLDMPGMDGLEFIRHLGESGWDVSLIVASALDHAVITSVEAMADAYGVRLLGAMSKPVTAARLAEVVALHGARAEEPSRVQQRLTLAEVKHALDEERLEAHFQPKVEVATGRLVGAECLVRWDHAQRGVLAAQAFLPLLEEAGLMARLDEFMLRCAVQACGRWAAAGVRASVAVNLSLGAASAPHLVDRLMQLIQEEGLEPRRLVLEITEATQAPHLGKALENLSRLRMRGFGLSIDDYGMGYSSLQQLLRIPFTELKIDRGFVRNAATRPSERAALESSLELAAKLRILAVAEGVETQADWDLVKSLGCDLAQGYFIAAAMPQHEFIAWARTRAAAG